MKQARARTLKQARRERGSRHRLQRLIKNIRRGEAGPNASLLAPGECAHEWERDGQTLLSVRWFCGVCGARRMS